MKLHKRILCGILLCICFSLTGCGTSLISMTDDEETQVILYAAKMISKYNRAQDKGYSYVDSDRKDEAKEESAKEDEAEENAEEQGDVMSFSDIIAIDGITFTYEGYDIMTSLLTSDVAIPDAEEGNSYIVLKIKAENTTERDLQVDLLNNVVKYKLSINEDVLVDCMTTLSMEDLSTYYNTAFGAGTTDDMILIFQTKTEYLNELTSMTLQVTKDGQTYNVKL